MLLTKPQLCVFWREFTAACANLGLSEPAEKEEYRHEVIRETTGQKSLTQVDRSGGFDALMLRLSIDAGDYDSAAHYSVSQERRTAAMVESEARHIFELQTLIESGPDGHGVKPVEYVLAICRQANIPTEERAGCWWMDVCGPDLFRLFQILDTHRRRLLRRLPRIGALSFSISASWTKPEEPVSLFKVSV